jgi:long-subunit acyl-CoA synthetase (AMP-forming)
MEARILREDGSGVNVGETGELWLRGPNVSPGYWNDEKASRETFVNGWLRTGDLFHADEQGFFLLVIFFFV